MKSITLRNWQVPWAALAAVVVAGLALTFLTPPTAHAETRVSGGVNVHFGGYRGPHYWHRGWYGGPRVGWSVGWGWNNWGDDDDWPGWGWYNPPVYAYAPPVVVERQVTQLPPAAPGPAPQSNWYYCDAAKAYYPYVSTCPGGWRAVPTTPEK